MSDNVKHPSHYCKGGMECIDAIKAAVSDIADPFEAYCTGNIIKYIWRWNDKNGVEDLNKAKQYADFIIASRKARTLTGGKSTDATEIPTYKCANISEHKGTENTVTTAHNAENSNLIFTRSEQWTDEDTVNMERFCKRQSDCFKCPLFATIVLYGTRGLSCTAFAEQFPVISKHIIYEPHNVEQIPPDRDDSGTNWRYPNAE